MAANGVYGINVPVNVDVEHDVDILYTYSETRNSDDVNTTTYTRLSSNLLQSVNATESYNGFDTVVEGMYNLKLPVKNFNKAGFYTVYIKPKEIPVVLYDIGTLSTYSNVKGLVIDTTAVGDYDTTNSSSYLQTLFQTNNALVGYRVIYLDNKLERQSYYRIITSNNKVEPVTTTDSTSNKNSIQYRYNESATLTFLTVTPSVASTFKANAEPYIGTSSQKCFIVNTKFEPIMIEIEMTNHDIETISTMLEGNQLRALDSGIVTTFNENDEIYHQTEHYSLKDQQTGKPVYEVRKKKTDSIDFTQTLSNK